MPTLSDFVDDFGFLDDTVTASKVAQLLNVARKFQETKPDLAVTFDFPPPIFGGEPPLPDPPVVLMKCYPRFRARVDIDDIIAALEALGAMPNLAKRIRELQNIRIVVGKMRDEHSDLSVTL